MSEESRRIALIAAFLVLLSAIGVAVYAARQGSERGAVAHLLALPPESLDAVLEEAAGFSDPLLRQVTLEEWLHRNQDALPASEASRLCAALGGVAMDVCLRKVNSPHLRAAGRP